MIDPTVQELVRRCQRTLPDDTHAFEQLVALYKGRVFAVAYRMMGSREEAEDQAQEVFIKVFRNIHTVEDPATFTGWITRITTNTCLDALTKQRRRPQTAPLTPPDAEGNEEPRYADAKVPAPDDVALRRESQQCIEQTLHQLDATARAVLVLRDIEDRPYQEIADTLKLGLSAVKMRIHRSRLAFQQQLEAICPELGRATSGL